MAMVVTGGAISGSFTLDVTLSVADLLYDETGTEGATDGNHAFTLHVAGAYSLTLHVAGTYADSGATLLADDYRADETGDYTYAYDDLGAIAITESTTELTATVAIVYDIHETGAAVFAYAEAGATTNGDAQGTFDISSDSDYDMVYHEIGTTTITDATAGVTIVIVHEETDSTTGSDTYRDTGSFVLDATGSASEGAYATHSSSVTDFVYDETATTTINDGETIATVTGTFTETGDGSFVLSDTGSYEFVGASSNVAGEFSLASTGGSNSVYIETSVSDFNDGLSIAHVESTLTVTGADSFAFTDAAGYAGADNTARLNGSYTLETTGASTYAYAEWGIVTVTDATTGGVLTLSYDSSDAGSSQSTFNDAADYSDAGSVGAYASSDSAENESTYSENGHFTVTDATTGAVTAINHSLTQ